MGRWMGMPYLMHIPFDNSNRLDRTVYYFKYKSIEFKLIQHGQKHQDVLLTILPESGDRVGKIYKVACEYLSALSWQNSAMVIITPAGGAERKETTLREAKCTMFAPRKVPWGYYSGRGYSILAIPKIGNDRQRKALALFRQAFSNLNPYFSFLFYWHVLGVRKRKLPLKRPSEWINVSFNKEKVHVAKEHLTRLHLGKQTLGDYLYDDCRNAIAHIERVPGKKELEIDDLDDLERIYISTRVIEDFAKYYVKSELGLTEKLHLAKKTRSGFPVYLAESQLWGKGYKIAYERKLPKF